MLFEARTEGSDGDPGTRGPLGWAMHLGLLLLYPIGVGLIGYGMADEGMGPALPPSVSGVLAMAVNELLLFGIVFALAWWASKANADDLRLRWYGGAWPILYGIFYSVLLRLAIVVVTLVVLLGAALMGVGLEEAAGRMRPRTEVLVDTGALLGDPVYLVLTMTLVSFVVAGLREELWRAGVIGGLEQLMPRWFSGRGGRLMAVVLASVVFGMGHLPQGWGGVALTTVLGVGLGWIMIMHRSIWPAVLAHGCFNATSFALLYWTKLPLSEGMLEGG